MRIVKLSNLSEEDKKRIQERQIQNLQTNKQNRIEANKKFNELIDKKGEFDTSKHTSTVGRLQKAYENNETANKSLNDYYKNNTTSLWRGTQNFADAIGRIGENTYKGAENGILSSIQNLGRNMFNLQGRKKEENIFDKVNKQILDSRKDLSSEEKTNITNKMNNSPLSQKNLIKGIEEKNQKFQEKKNENTFKIQQNTDSISNPVGKYLAGEIAPSIGQMLPGLLPGIGTTYFISLATGNYHDDAIQRGMTEDQATIYSGTMGIIEGALESLGANLTKNVGKQLLKKNIKGALVNYGLDIGENFLEESIVEPISEIAAQVYGGKDKADWSNIVQRIIKSGAAGALTSAITGGVSGIIGGVGSKVNQQNQYVDYDTNKKLNKDSQNWLKQAENIIQENSTPRLSPQLTQNEQNTTTQQITPIQQENVLNSNMERRNYQYQSTDNQKINNLRKDMSKYWDNSQKTIDLGNTIEKIITDKNYNVRLDDTIINNNGQLVNAQIKSLPNGELEIKINPNSKNVGEFLIIHEATHAIQTQEMKQLVLDYANKNIDFNNALEDLKQTYGVEDVSDEVLCDISGQLFGNQEFINNLSMQKPNIFKRIYNKIIELANKITGNSNEALFIRNLANKWQEAYRTQNNNLQQDTEYSIAGKIGMNNAIKTNTNNLYLERNYNKAQKMQSLGIENENIRQSTGWFQDRNGDWKFEFSDKDMSLKNIVLSQNKIYKLGNMLEHDTLFTTYPQLKDLKIQFKDLNKINGSYNKNTNIITLNNKLLEDNKKIEGTLIHEIQHVIQNIEGFEKGMTSKLSKKLYYESLGEIEADDTRKRFIEEKYRNINIDNVVPESSKTNPKHRRYDNYMNKRTKLDKLKDTVFKYTKGLGGNNEIFQENDYKNIQQNIGLVDGRRTGRHLKESENNSGSFSLQDNKGRKLSKEQQEFFKDSKVRDEKGNLLTVYHGTPNTFTQFRYDFIGSNGTALGKGFYLTDNIDIANSYGKDGKVMELYVDIKKPLSLNSVNISKNEYKKFIKAIDKKTEGQFLSDYGEVEYEGYNNVLNRAIDSYDYNESDVDLVHEVLNTAGLNWEKGFRILKDTLGYDGIIEENFNGTDSKVYVAVLPEQIKNINNINPTNNPDIRYSKTNNTWKEFLNKNYKATGTRTNLQDIKNIAPIAKDVKNNAPIKNTSNTQVQQENVEAPISGDAKARKHYKSIMESNYTSDEAKAISKELMGTDTYIPDSNEKQLQRANERIQNSTPDSELNSFMSKVMNGEKITATDIAVGEKLIQYYSKSGDKGKLQDVIQATAMAGTSAGQTVQALSLLNHQTPEGQAIWLQRSVDKMNNDLKKSRGANAEQFNLTEDMVNKIVDSKNNEELSNNLNDVYKELGQQVSKTNLQKIDAWRYFSMLANPKTHIRNIVGNTAMAGVQSVKNKVAGTIEGVISKVNPNMERNHTIISANKEVTTFAKNDIKNVADRLGLNENKYNPKTRLENSMRTFKSDALENTIGKLFDLNDNLLEAEDGWGLKAGYTKALSEYMTANKLNPDTITDKQLAKARKYAVEQAQEATFHQVSAIASALNQFQNKNGLTKFITDSTLPFKKTPINVAKTGFQYSPVGLVTSLLYDTVNLRKGNITINKYIDNISKGLTGTGIALLGYALADAGILKASGVDDKDKEKYDEEIGKQTYSITIAGNTYSLDWLAPTGIPLFIGAECHEIMQTDKEEKTSSSDENSIRNQAIKSATNILDSFTNAMNPMTEMSMLSGLTSALKSYEQGSSQILASLGTNAVKSYVNQFVPTAVGQIARTTDEYERNTTSTKTGGLPKAIDTTKNQIMNKIPGLRQKLPIKTDIWGKQVKQSDNIIQRGLENSVFPWTRKEVSTSKVDNELTKLYNQTGESTILPDTLNKKLTINGQNYRLTNEEYNKYKTSYGKTSYNLLNKLVSSSEYKNMSSSQKQTAIENIYDYAKEKNKVDYANKVKETIETSINYNILEELKKSGENQIQYLNYLSKTKEVQGEKATQKKNQLLLDANYSSKTKSIIYQNTTGKEDKLYDILSEERIDINEYLDYKIRDSKEEFSVDKDSNGKSVSGSSKTKIYNYVNKNITGVGNRLVIIGSKYKLNDNEVRELAKYINNTISSKDKKIEIFKKLDKNYTVKDGKVYYK